MKLSLRFARPLGSSSFSEVAPFFAVAWTERLVGNSKPFAWPEELGNGIVVGIGRVETLASLDGLGARPLLLTTPERLGALPGPPVGIAYRRVRFGQESMDITLTLPIPALVLVSKGLDRPVAVANLDVACRLCGRV